jgi:hypothetical protein
MPFPNRIMVSHEVPICLLKESRHFNDYDYALVHLFESNPEYFNFFKDSKRIYNRMVLLDNSLFELGRAFDSKQYMHWIEQLNPTLAVIPDVFENGQETIQAYQDFDWEYGSAISNQNVLKIGAVHGKNWHHLLKCYRYMSEHADVIAISFGFSYYQMIGEGETYSERAVSGRQRLIRQLIDCGAWNWNKPHHLLGCELPQEFSYYINNNIYNIRTLDTSSPIVHGINNISYQGIYGLKEKCKIKLADLMNVQIDEDQKSIIEYNISQFQQMLNGNSNILK